MFSGVGPLTVPHTDTSRTPEFDALCDRIGLSESIREKSWTLVSRVKTDDQILQKASEATLASCAIFLACKTERIGRMLDEDVGVPVCNGLFLPKLLEFDNVQITDFFKALKLFIDRFHLDRMFEFELKAMQLQCVVSISIANKYLLLFRSIFPPTESTQASRREMVCSFGWHLYLVVKHRVLGYNADLLSSFHLLLAIFHVFVRHAGVHLAMETHLSTARGSENAHLAVAQLLCRATNTNLHAVTTIIDSAQSELAKMVVEGILACQLQQHSYGDKRFALEGLLDDSNVPCSLHRVSEQYLSLLGSCEILDERVFLSQAEATIATTGGGEAPQFHFTTAPSTPSRKPAHNQSSPGSSASGNQQIPSTPLGIAMQTSNWLEREFTTIAQPREGEPGELAEVNPTLARFCGQCTPNPIESIQQRLTTLVDALDVPGLHLTHGMFSRTLVVKRLYFRVLTSMLVAEECRLQKSSFPGLLHNDKFHRTLISISLEVVATSFQIPQLRFPAPLTFCSVSAFDFQKVVAFFIKHESTLPRAMKEHLEHLEERILEEIAWGEAALHTYIEEANKQERAHTPPSTTTSTTTTTSSMVPPATPDRQTSHLPPFTPDRPTAVAIATPSTPATSSSTSEPPNRALKLFFRKLLRLASTRLQRLTSLLHLSSKVNEQVWAVVEHIINTGLRSLLFNRHLDQIILCGVFGVCKVNKLPITFKHLMQEYLKLPRAQTKVFKEVLVGPERLDIIAFYNQVFVPSVKSFLFQFPASTPAASPASRKRERDGTSPKRAGIMSPPAAPTAAAPSPNVILSPMRRWTPSGGAAGVSPAPAAMTPRTSVLFAFGESPSRDLASINQRVNRPARSRLSFDEVADPLPANSGAFSSMPLGHRQNRSISRKFAALAAAAGEIEQARENELSEYSSSSSLAPTNNDADDDEDAPEPPSRRPVSQGNTTVTTRSKTK